MRNIARNAYQQACSAVRKRWPFGGAKVVQNLGPTIGNFAPLCAALTKSHQEQPLIDKIDPPEGNKFDRDEYANLFVKIPKYVKDQVETCAAREKVTMKLVILRSLQSQGFSIDEMDLVSDKRKQRR